MKKIDQNITDDAIKTEFKELMLCLKSERNSKFPVKGKELALKLSKTVNYFNAIENGNEFPSMKLFLNYLMLCNFDLSPLKNLKINNTQIKYSNSERTTLIKKILNLEDVEISFLHKQLQILETYKLKERRR